MYLDTAILLKLVVHEPDSTHYARLVDRQIVWSSSLCIAECFSALLRKEREGLITPSHRNAAWRQIEGDIGSGAIGVVPTTDALLGRANTLLARVHPKVALRSLDAIHLAAADEARSWPLCTNDARMRAAATMLAMPLTPLP